MRNGSLRAEMGGALIFYLPDDNPKHQVPFFFSTVQAGFPSPAEDYLEDQLDLHKLVVRHPTSTFFVKAQGESMRDAGIDNGDTLVVDRSVNPSDGKIVVCFLNGAFTVKRLSIQKNGVVRLLAENPKMPPIVLQDQEELRVFGVVTWVLKKME